MARSLRERISRRLKEEATQDVAVADDQEVTDAEAPAEDEPGD